MADPRPNPTSDLHWSDYRGAIHQIFAANANKHPERTCVVETASSNSPKRVFTYKHINESSNVLAHHLVASGVQRGEVVMVYAHRGVDLVVAVMGVLKAGATFSVIDPLYPADRQIIYLDVAKPRALVVIEKASQEAGELSATVREYIQENLRLRTEVPGLQLQDDGSVIGGNVDGRDCLEAQQQSRAQLPDVVVGPDSTPTLSFTSGSEGRPKGVKGRHFSLAYYFPWMQERFGLSEKDHFSMLSGIAHDPIQRDIFTPLFLGARLIVPPAEDITFDRLAKWASDNEISVTHLTPAMGQILLGSLEPKVNSLHSAFFVGDILLKRDCRRLQDLAPNVRIKNMYGTTETQRAVSFYEIPSKSEDASYLDKMGDVIPAGKGMLDVQLLVVDRSNRDRICEVGEIGEIYVRAGGLAEGYLGPELKELTNSKFVQNWFVDNEKWVKEDQEKAANAGKDEPWREFYKGPRDRLYRSGDLGRYTADGNVECTGRADDQVKIRGFRIELGEIDTHLSQHPLIRENVTLVKRDHEEEQILVSYYVPDLNKWSAWKQSRGEAESNVADDLSIPERLKMFNTLTNDVREHLKKKLASYAVPTLFIPMVRLPLTPNGKVDKRALPFPEKSELLAASSSQPVQDAATRSDTEKALAEIWALYLRSYAADSIPSNVPFFDLGGNSIAAVQIPSQIRKKWPDVTVPVSAISKNPTLQQLAGDIDRSLNPVGLRLDAQAPETEDQEEFYSNSLPELIKEIPAKIQSASRESAKQQTVFLTGATGFLGSYILRDLLSSGNKVIAHVRAKSTEDALQRVKATCQAYGIWTDSWASNLECVTGDLQEQPLLGMQQDVYDRVAKEADVVIHNGAIVHWLKPYSSLKSANVLSTISAIKLCATGKAKKMAFVSSTSALDSDHYVELSKNLIASGAAGVSESDDMEGSRQGLTTGYGQGKWVSERLMEEAGRRGLVGSIIRAGYVLGDPKTGTTNTDDFLIRMLKGCVQVGSRPDITNTINMVPVDHVARLVIATALNQPVAPMVVCHVTGHPRLTFNQYLAALEAFGYEAPKVDFPKWRDAVEKFVEQGKEEHALLGLYHMVTGDLPGSTKAPELDDRNAAAALKADAARSGQDFSAGSAVTEDIVGQYLSFLIARGFMPKPTKKGIKTLPEARITQEQIEALDRVGGRGGAA
ncbi:large subunit of L-aminoadipate-semialdehyde dehydrogenase, partial [Aureobasidium melanogenum]|uniref:Alpha-aminoadipate reductase n=1 Tax=Aureobasidium melanogenum (strain CBS 110374) TaxID=1043003 RepID=A0A074VYA3_AURM1